ncbi:hypothetical protein L1887_07074 [Cichorium endivia]|nr:hypothetical protein L1887_07074 [Cichorium endivia]
MCSTASSPRRVIMDFVARILNPVFRSCSATVNTPVVKTSGGGTEYLSYPLELVLDPGYSSLQSVGADGHPAVAGAVVLARQVLPASVVSGPAGHMLAEGPGVALSVP